MEKTTKGKKKTAKSTEETKEKEIKVENAEETTAAPETPAADEKDEQIAKLSEQLMRNMAEYDNYRKRTAKEKLELEPIIIAKAVGEIFPVIDNLERALQAECSDEAYKKGIEMIYDSFVEALSRLGVEEIESEGVEFNPAYHQAVQQVQNDELESGIIASTFQKGYKIGEKVLRFSMVAVVS